VKAIHLWRALATASLTVTIKLSRMVKFQVQNDSPFNCSCYNQRQLDQLYIWNLLGEGKGSACATTSNPFT
jgi:hypothetical protein